MTLPGFKAEARIGRPSPIARPVGSVCLREKYNWLSVAPAGKSARAIPTACNVVCAFIAADIPRSAASEAGRLTQGL
jgi:hypothetical protein